MRNAILAVALILIVSASTLGQQGKSAPEPTVKLPPELARVLTDYEAAWRSRDAAALTRLFAKAKRNDRRRDRAPSIRHK